MMDFPNEWGVSIPDPERRIKELESEVERLNTLLKAEQRQTTKHRAIREALADVDDARNYAAEIAQGVSHYPHGEGEPPCVRCERDEALAEVERLRDWIGLCNQCGRLWADRACGPTHAAFAHSMRIPGEAQRQRHEGDLARAEVERLKAERGEFSDVLHRATLAEAKIDELIRRNKAREKQLREKSRRLTEAQERIEAALALHVRREVAPNDYECETCDCVWPCPTIKALKGGRLEPEPKTLYGFPIRIDSTLGKDKIRLEGKNGQISIFTAEDDE